jgi:hypothetical protein
MESAQLCTDTRRNSLSRSVKTRKRTSRGYSDITVKYLQRTDRCRRPNTHPIVRRINLQGAGIHRQIAGDGGGGDGKKICSLVLRQASVTTQNTVVIKNDLSVCTIARRRRADVSLQYGDLLYDPLNSFPQKPCGIAFRQC